MGAAPLSRAYTLKQAAKGQQRLEKKLLVFRPAILLHKALKTLTFLSHPAWETALGGSVNTLPYLTTEAVDHGKFY